MRPWPALAGSAAAVAGWLSWGWPGAAAGAAGLLLWMLPPAWRLASLAPVAVLALPVPGDAVGIGAAVAAAVACAAITLDVAGPRREGLAGVGAFAAACVAAALLMPRARLFVAAEPALAAFLAAGAALVSVGLAAALLPQPEDAR
ncbi:MAG TPA: hypothetical protein VFH47_00015 [Candidatus Thermoplasmatota archaeon]|nr:hypothetical protein [Candidatus Thermoplasmatota archaeon]